MGFNGVKCFRDGTANLKYEIAYTDYAHTTQQHLVRVTDHGQLITGSKTGQANLLITANEEFGVNQTLVVLIKVGYKVISNKRGVTFAQTKPEEREF